MRIRKLAVLDLNDWDVPSFRSGTGVARHFDVRRLRTWKNVQQDLAGPDAFRPDIVLADIDFEQDPSVEEISFPDCGDAKPIGPLLALPYVAGRPVWTFAIYSAHFNRGTSGVMESPWVLLPFGILVAKMEGRVFDSRSLLSASAPACQDTLEDYLAAMPRVGNPSDALKEALDLHNTRLVAAISAKRVRVTNAEMLGRTLRRLTDDLRGGSAGSTINVDPDVHLELYSRSFGIDRIQWLSLCADIVDFSGDSINIDGATTMLAFAHALSDADPTFQKAVEVIREQDNRETATGERPPFDCVAFDLYGSEPVEVRREVLRLGVLFANTHGWAYGKFTALPKKEVFATLGLGDEGNQYKGWFGQRSKSGMVCGRTLKVPALSVFTNSAGHASIFLEWDATVLSDEDKTRVLHFLESFEESAGYHIPASLPYLS